MTLLTPFFHGMTYSFHGIAEGGGPTLCAYATHIPQRVPVNWEFRHLLPP